ncbi:MULTISPECIES: hypothetical protein [Cupriavidus]|jgi:hypothetical protein|uniref:hypothetical protein n=1 Tax=Cupriavidus TaxID=106589 RepID=UPI000465872C|nr:hypothetical protein [Cupriavidus metallidurans]AVA38297.1 hypothetical protein C3Z06_32345 [Cupriavidus metallidurans]KWW32298.1 hypothetical protein AU374_05898 [Cupriavidus metallidurans]
MNLSDFHIGLEFVCGPFWYRCTDVGTRTVVAIRLVENDPVWYQGPPYLVDEVVLDETEIVDCHLTEEDAIHAALDAADNSGHPGYPKNVVSRMLDAEHNCPAYPRKGLLRLDRVTAIGEILHPYAARQLQDGWIIQLYVPFTQEWAEMPEREFIALSVAVAADVRSRADQTRRHD